MCKLNTLFSLSIVFFIVLSCNKTNRKTEIKRKVKNESVKNDSVKSVVIKRERNVPIEEFKQFVIDLQSDNWFFDTLRTKKRNFYNLGKIKPKLFNRFPFYRIQFNNTNVEKAFKMRPYNGKFTDSINIDLLKQVRSIWGYTYRGKMKDNIISDGVIEQWEFENETKANKALVELKAIGIMAYFNTKPYYSKLENYVFIFHTRGMGFSFEQKPLYKRFCNSYIKSKDDLEQRANGLKPEAKSI